MKKLVLKSLLTSTIILLAITCAVAQTPTKVWNLQRCIQYATQNSLNIKRANIAVENAQLTEKASRLARYPNLNASGNYNINLGRSIDPTTNEFNAQSFQSNGFSLSTGVTLFNGGRINNTIKQSKLDMEAAKIDMDAAKNDIALNVAASYLQILLADEQLANARRQLVQTEDQLKQTNQLIDAGVIPANDRLDIEAQIAQNQQVIIQAENAVQSNYLVLYNLLEKDLSENIIIEVPEVSIPDDANPNQFTFEQVMASAIGIMPELKAQEVRQESAALGVDIARAGKLPTLSIGGGVNTNWASLAKEFVLDPNGAVELGSAQPFNVGGMDVLVAQYFPSGELVNKAYGSQLNENFGQAVGISLNIPIYNNGRNDINIQRAQLNVLNSEVAYNQALQGVKANVQRAVADAKAGEKNYQAAQKTMSSAEIAYANAKKRFDLGAINTFELTTAKARLDAAEISMTQAKFQYLFNLKILDFYLGRKLTID